MICQVQSKLSPIRRASPLPARFVESHDAIQDPVRLAANGVTLGSVGGATKALEAVELHELYISREVLCGLLRGCIRKKDLAAGRRVHSLMVRIGVDSIAYYGDHLIRFFTSCGSLPDAIRAFRQVSKPSLYTWNSIITAHVKLGEGERALGLYRRMQQAGMNADRITIACILKACTDTRNIGLGRDTHSQAIMNGLKSDLVIGNTLVDMYAKVGSVEEACNVFSRLPNRNVVSWGAIIGGYAMHGHGFLAMKLFGKMQQEGILPNAVILLCILKACGGLGAVRQGRLIHEQVIWSGAESYLTIGSSLVDMYAKCGNLEEAHQVFEKLSNKNVVSWGAMIGGYARREHGLLVLELFEKMQEEGVEPNIVIFLWILKACGNLGALYQGRLIHDQIIKYRLASDVIIGSTLVDTYARCGSLDEAFHVFDNLPYRSIVSWDAMITGCARCGNYMMARQFLEDMHHHLVKPDEVIFAGILTACSHAGEVKQGFQYFESMIQDHGIWPSMEQYSCMIQLLGSTGCMNEAENLLQTMPIRPGIGVWRSLLTSCRTYGNTELGRRCFDEAMQLDANDASGYVLMSNIYADAHM